MVRLLSNGEGKDFVRGRFEKLAAKSKELQLAAPYFTYAEPLVQAMARGSTIKLLVGLNSATHPDALRVIMADRRAAVRFYTGRFHAKLYVFDDDVLVGSANLTQSGFQSNREVVAWLNESDDQNAIQEARVIFATLWESARALSLGTLNDFEQAWLANRPTVPDDAAITAAVGQVEPPTVSVEKRLHIGVKIALERLRRQIQEEYKPAFEEVSAILMAENLYREDVADIDIPFRTNRFLNWLRLTQAPGEEWKEAPVRQSDQLRTEIIRFGQAWCAAKDGRVSEGYAEGIQGVLAPFANPSTLDSASRDELTAGLLGIHAFREQYRFTPGGENALGARFWAENNYDVTKVRETIGYLLHGKGDFVTRLHSITTNSYYKIARFGKFCGLELCGTVNPTECPPVNGRSAKALRFLGFKVTAD